MKIWKNILNWEHIPKEKLYKSILFILLGVICLAVALGVLLWG